MFYLQYMVDSVKNVNKPMPDNSSIIRVNEVKSRPIVGILEEPASHYKSVYPAMVRDFKDHETLQKDVYIKTKENKVKKNKFWNSVFVILGGILLTICSVSLFKKLRK